MILISSQQVLRPGIDRGEENWSVLFRKDDTGRQTAGAGLIDNLQRLYKAIQPGPLLGVDNIPVRLNDRVRRSEQLSVWQAPQDQ